jgi:nitrate reductase NapE
MDSPTDPRSNALQREQTDERTAAGAAGGGHVRRMEIYAFLIVTAVLMPALAVATVGTWGLGVWIYQAINGPPGPPSR